MKLWPKRAQSPFVCPKRNSMGKAVPSCAPFLLEPQSRPQAPQSRPQAPRTKAHNAKAKAKPKAKKAKAKPKAKKPPGLTRTNTPETNWRATFKYLKQAYYHFQYPSIPLKLLRIVRCSSLMTGVEAEVRWLTGGISLVTLPAAVAAVKPGVYFATACPTPHPEVHYSPGWSLDVDASTPEASLRRLRWVGTRVEIFQAALESKEKLISGAFRSSYGRMAYLHLMQMLQDDSDSDSDSEAAVAADGDERT
jgi:hypothetical protein